MARPKTLEEYDEVVNPRTGNKVDMKKLLFDQRCVISQINAHYPFFSTLIDKLKFVYCWSVSTQATDGVRLLINPEFTAGLDIHMKAFVLMHEAMHCALCHMTRAKRRGDDHRRSNVAGDYEINGTLVDTGIWTAEEIKEFLYDPKFSGLSYETIYDRVSGNEGRDNDDLGSDDGNEGPQDGDKESGGGGGQGEDNTPKSADYMEGWNKALEDYKNGKIKLD